MRGKIFSVLIVLYLIFSLFSVSAISEESHSTELELWYIDESDVSSTLLDLIDSYETEKGITVNATFIPEVNASELFKAAFLDDKAPDLLQARGTWIPELATNKMISSINESQFLVNYMQLAKRAVSYYEIINDVIQGNSILYYGFPQAFEIQAFVYNVQKAKSMGATVPAVDTDWTVDEFKNVITQINDQSDPENKQFGFSFGELPYSVEPLFFGSNGIKFSDYKVDQEHIQIESEASVAALQFLFDFVNTYRLTPEYENQGATNTYIGFAEDGTISSTFAFASEIKHILEGAQFSDESNLGIRGGPLNTNVTGSPLHVKAFLVTNQKSAEKKPAAIELAQALTSIDAMKDNAKNEYLLPTVLSVYDDKELKDNTIIQAYKEILDSVTQNPISKHWEVLQHDPEGSFSTDVELLLKGNLNGTKTGLGIRIHWSSHLEQSVDYPPILPASIESPSKQSPWSTDVFLLAIGILVIFSVKKRKKKVL